MGKPVQSSGTELQLLLSDYLYAETLHSLGSYQLACTRLGRLEGELGEGGDEARGALAGAVRDSLQCNENLLNRLHRAPTPGQTGHLSSRRPSPFSDADEAGDDGKQFEPNAELLGKLARFYRDSEDALVLFRSGQDLPQTSNPDDGARLGAKLSFIHDPQRRGGSPAVQSASAIDSKINRTRARLKTVESLVPGSSVDEMKNGGPPDGSRFTDLIESCAEGKHVLMPTIIEAFSEAHMWMHKAENVGARGFGEMFTKIPENHAKVLRMLRYAAVLNTFVFVAARSACWIFAEDDVERRDVVDDYANCCNRLAPTYCMWIAVQFSLLALHRRAFATWTTGEHDVAYRDFHKLTRFLRGLRRPAQNRGLRAPGTNTFIEGITAMSELHIGRIYRGQHAYGKALRYFRRATRRTRRWEGDDEIGPLIKSSHWRVTLLLNEGKANFELGHHKRTILQYARAWRAFLQLVQAETHATANTDVVDGFIDWLKPVVDDPELSRVDLRDQIEPLVEQFVTLRTPVHLRLLAADIVMRMGHLIFILRLPHRSTRPPLSGRGLQRYHQLALDCVEQALFLDPTSTLAAGDLLNICEARAELEQLDALAEAREYSPPLDQPTRPRPCAPLKEQWPSGGGAFEDAARITELTLQRWLASAAAEGASDEQPRPVAKIAHGLLRSFLTHTDSSNMKLAQVYGYLMRDGKPKLPLGKGQYTLDFVCMRRYSSFFPFLPRPAAFHASGGGYLLQLNEPRLAKPFGIAVDPGPDFIENLYACGYSIADVQMIVLTHDHADHIASVDALLALMGIRRELGDRTFDQEKGECLAIVGNQSVLRRYSHFGEPHPVKLDEDRKENAARSDAVRVIGFRKMAEITHLDKGRSKRIEDAEIVLKPRYLSIEPVKTWGHTDANGYPAQGFRVRFGPSGKETSILFTGDTGSPTLEKAATGRDAAEELYAEDGPDLLDAVTDADIVVAHLSAVPLRELRDLSRLGSGDRAAVRAVAEYTELWDEAAAQARMEHADEDERKGVEQTQFLLNQIQFGFRSRPGKKREDFSVSPFSDREMLRRQPERHLYLTGLMEIAERMAGGSRGRPLLLIGELREELGTFRTQIAKRFTEAFVDPATRTVRPMTLTTDIGLRVRLSRSSRRQSTSTRILCSTCDLDNDLLDNERYHPPEEIHELCVKGEDEGVFYNCSLHDPRYQEGNYWVESVERYDVFGD